MARKVDWHRLQADWQRPAISNRLQSLISLTMKSHQRLASLVAVALAVVVVASSMGAHGQTCPAWTQQQVELAVDDTTIRKLKALLDQLPNDDL